MYKPFKMLVVCIVFCFVCCSNVFVEAQKFESNISGISALAYVVMDADTKSVLYAHNADKCLPMASTTKIMTTLLALEQENRDVYFTVDTQAIQTEGSSMGLMENDSVSLNSLCYGMLLNSGNDAANATAVRISGSVESFAKKMNEKAKSLGMENSNFTNPSGLPDENHYSTAYDMALLGCEALSNDDFTAISSVKKAAVSYGNPPYKRWLSSHNKMLDYYEGCVGLKTGYTDAAGRCLVTGVKKNGINLVCVTLNAPNDWVDQTTLLDLAYQNIVTTEPNFLPSDTTSALVVGGIENTVAIEEQISTVTTTNQMLESDLQTEVILEPFYYAPITKGDVLGKVVAKKDGVIVFENTITATEDVNKKIIPEFTEKDATKENLLDIIIGFFASLFK